MDGFLPVEGEKNYRQMTGNETFMCRLICVCVLVLVFANLCTGQLFLPFYLLIVRRSSGNGLKMDI